MNETVTEKVCAVTGHKPPNVDVATGIHYGVINQNQLSSEAVDDIMQNGTDEGWEEFHESAVEDLVTALSGVLDDLTFLDAAKREGIRETAENIFDEYGCGDGFESNGPYVYTSDGYEISFNPEDGDLFVIKSPYFTSCRECSPCAPNAGYLTSQPGALKTYCLFTDWFDNSQAPYPIYSVETNELVFKPAQPE